MWTGDGKVMITDLPGKKHCIKFITDLQCITDVSCESIQHEVIPILERGPMMSLGQDFAKNIQQKLATSVDTQPMKTRATLKKK